MDTTEFEQKPEPDTTSNSSVIRLAPMPDLEVEKALLGVLVADFSDTLISVLETNIKDTDFFKEAHRDIFSAILDLNSRGEPVDLLILTEALKKKGTLARIGGMTYLSELTDSLGVPFNAVHYAKLIIERSTIRRLIHVAAEISEKCCNNTSSAGHLLDEAEAAIMKIRDTRSNHEMVKMSEKLGETFDNINDLIGKGGGLSGLPTGYKDLDRLTGGLQCSDLLILAGRPGMGKTSLALNLALNAALPRQRQSSRELPGATVAIFSLEMSTEQLLQRLISQVGRHDLLKMRTGNLTREETQRMTGTLSTLQEADIWIDDTASLKPLELRAKARRLQSQLKNKDRKLGLIVVDYLQLMRPNTTQGNRNREQEVSEISGSLKSLAKELNVPILTLSQVNRQSEKSNKPNLSDLRESGSIEQDADIVMFISHSEPVDAEVQYRVASPAELTIRKHRNGPTGVVHLTFLKEHSTFAPSAFEAIDN